MTYWTNKSIVITGGSSGLGVHLARAFTNANAQVTLVARNLATLQQVQTELGSNTRIVQADVTDDASVEQLFQQLQSESIDAWINTVGKSDRGKILDVSADDFRELIDLNFLSAVRCSRLAVPRLLETKGHLVNIGSLAAKSASSFLGAYPASKFPLAAYSQQLRLELGPAGLHVLLVCPGPIDRPDSGNRYDSASEGLPESARKPGGGVRVKRLSPEKLAQSILLACERRKPELIMPAKAKVLFAISQVFPRLGDWIVRKKTSG